MSDSEKSKIEAIFRLLHTQIIGDLNDKVLNGIEQFGIIIVFLFHVRSLTSFL